MRNFVAVDPGKHACGVSIWGYEGPADLPTLRWAGFVENPNARQDGFERAEQWGQMGHTVALKIGDKCPNSMISLILEIPQIYGKVTKEDPNDLLDLAGVQGAVVGCMDLVTVEWSPRPAEWKGQAPKAITVQRVDAKLTSEEKSRIEWPAKSLRHNVYDAIHLGIVFLEREGLREFVK